MNRTPRATQAALALLGLTLAGSGCSPRDPVRPPSFRVGTPTNRSTVNSWEINREPFHTQPGVNGGKPVILAPVPSQRGFEPNDPLAEAVYDALVQDGTFPTKYLSASAQNGVVILTGTVDTAAEKARAERIARSVPGVKEVRSQIRALSGGR